MHEYKDGTFGPIQPASDLLAQLTAQARIPHDLKAVHFGSVKRLERVRERATRRLEGRKRVQEIEDRVQELEARLNASVVDQHTTGVRVYPADALPKGAL